MRKIIYIISSIISSILAVSCEDKIQVDLPPAKNQIVVEAWLKSDTAVKIVKLSRTSAFTEKRNIPEVGAKVFVENQTGLEVQLIENEPGVYSIEGTKLPIVVGNTYTLKFQTLDGRKYSSLPQKVTSAAPIDNYLFLSGKVIAELQNGPPFVVPGYFTSITYVEKLGRGDNYIFKMFENGVDVTTGFNLIFRNDDFIEDGARIPFDLGIFQDSIQLGDTVKIESMTCTKEAYDFFTALQQQQASGNPFSTPPAPVEGNMRNIDDENELVLGCFIVTDVFSFTEIVKDNGTLFDRTFEEFTPELQALIQASQP